MIERRNIKKMATHRVTINPRIMNDCQRFFDGHHCTEVNVEELHWNEYWNITHLKACRGLPSLHV